MQPATAKFFPQRQSKLAQSRGIGNTVQHPFQQKLFNRKVAYDVLHFAPKKAVIYAGKVQGEHQLLGLIEN